MKKLIICLNVFALALCSGAAYSKAVDEATAKTIGSNYLLSIGINGVNNASDLATGYVATAKVNGGTVTDYYVFNFKSAKGFVIVSGDDNVIPILAYSSESYFDISNMSPDAKWWMEGYKNQITYVIEHEVPAQAGTREQWTNLKSAKPAEKTAERTTSIFPSSSAHLVQTQWDQAPGYNNSCPTGAGGRAVTGCVATCMAEIMQYWSWPSVGLGAHTYTPPGYGAQSADFGNTAYNWTSINSSLTASNPAIALLMYHAGVSVDMQYSATESGAWVINLESYTTMNSAENALKTYFHYKPTLRGYPRFGEPVPASLAPIPDATWITMIKAELDANRPVIYTGSGSDGGHCWACDGYNAAGQFHFNFGWSGFSNGFYSINSVAPPDLGTGGGAAGNNFNNDQCIIVGIEPDSFPATPTGNIKMAANLDCATSQPMKYAAPFLFSTKINNANATSFAGDFCAQVFDTLNVLKGTIQTLTSQTIAAGVTSPTMTFATTAMRGLVPEDHYYVRVMYRPTGTTTWTPVANSGSFYNYNIIDVADDTDILLYSATSVTSALPVPLAGTISVFSQLANYSTNDFSGTVEAVLLNISTGTSYTIQTLPGSALGAGLYDNFNFSGSIGSAPTGTYALEIKHQYNGAGNFYVSGNRLYQNPILVHVGSSVGVGNITALEEKVSVYPNPANDVININTDGVAVSAIRIADIEGHQVMQLTTGNQSILTLPVSRLAAGMYFVQLQTEEGLLTKKIVIAK